MPWRYLQASGWLSAPDGHLLARGYAGKAEGKNTPTLERVHNVGPLPVGDYTIGAPRDTKTHGPFVLPLTPAPENAMYGRSGFLIHGDSLQHPGEASDGCVILPLHVRQAIAASDDRVLRVQGDAQGVADGRKA